MGKLFVTVIACRLPAVQAAGKFALHDAHFTRSGQDRLTQRLRGRRAPSLKLPTGLFINVRPYCRAILVKLCTLGNFLITTIT
jgi:hypothetical protein